MKIKAKESSVDLPEDFYQPLKDPIAYCSGQGYCLLRVRQDIMDSLLHKENEKGADAFYGVPNKYSMHDRKIFVHPVPSEDMNIELVYFSPPKVA